MEDKEKITLAINTLQNIIDSCVHPDTAARAVLVDLKPIRKVIKILKEESGLQETQ